jgi:hypothetical protein
VATRSGWRWLVSDAALPVLPLRRPRPRPVLVPDVGVLVPPELCAQLAGALDWFAAECAGVVRPGATRRPVMSAGLAELQLMAARAARAAERGPEQQHGERSSAALAEPAGATASAVAAG